MPYFEVQLTKKLHRLYEITGQDTAIGRAPQCQIQLLSRAVSRRHARVEFDGRQAIISDMGTKNGIKLNGQRIQGAAVVSEGDTVVVGDIQMVYRAASRSFATQDVIDLRDRPAGPTDLQACMRPKVTFLLRADPRAIAQFQATIARARISHTEFDDVAKFKLQIALREGIENARLHGNQGDRNRFIHITFSEDKDEFVMSVTDEGNGFNVDAALASGPELDVLEVIRNRNPAMGPLGLRIMLGCVDRLQFAGSGSTIYLGKIKAAGQLFVISEDDSEFGAVEEPSDSTFAAPGQPGIQQAGPPNPGSSPGPWNAPSSEEGPIDLGDLF